MEDYTLEKMKNDLDNGFGLYFNYNNNYYLIYKVADNCYSQELVTVKEKSPHAKLNLISNKALNEMFPFMKDIEYKVR